MGPRPADIVGEWRSLVAHLLWEQRVAGSNPVSPTITPLGKRHHARVLGEEGPALCIPRVSRDLESSTQIWVASLRRQ